MSSFDTTRTALLLIDVQASFPARPYWQDRELPAYLDATRRLLAGCQAQGIPVVQVFHSDGPESPDNPFAHASGLVRPLDGLPAYTPALRVDKHRHSALVGTGLGDWLRAQGIGRLIVAGIRTEQCCETTTRHASDLGYQVDYVTEATLTFAMTDRGGRVWPPAEIRACTELVLDKRFARIVDVAAALEGPEARQVA